MDRSSTTSSVPNINASDFGSEDCWYRNLPHIIIDGLMGAGKSELLAALRDYDTFGDQFLYFEAPENLYSEFSFKEKTFDPLKILFHTASSDADRLLAQQHMCKHSRRYYIKRLHPRYTHYSHVHYLRIFEGSVYSTVPFIHTWARQGHFSDFALRHLLSIAQESILRTYSWAPGLIIYLDIDEHLALKRLQAKKDLSQTCVTLEFLKVLKQEQLKQIEQFKQKFNVRIIRIDEETTLDQLKRKCFRLILFYHHYCCTQEWLKDKNVSDLLDKRYERRQFLRRFSLPSHDSVKLREGSLQRFTKYTYV